MAIDLKQIRQQQKPVGDELIGKVVKRDALIPHGRLPFGHHPGHGIHYPRHIGQKHGGLTNPNVRIRPDAPALSRTEQNMVNTYLNMINAPPGSARPTIEIPRWAMEYVRLYGQR